MRRIGFGQRHALGLISLLLWGALGCSLDFERLGSKVDAAVADAGGGPDESKLEDTGVPTVDAGDGGDVSDDAGHAGLDAAQDGGVGSDADACMGACTVGQVCSNATDCASGQCSLEICRPACAAVGCAVGEACVDHGDCQGDMCGDGVCRPACSGSCAPGAACGGDDDCAGSAGCDPGDHVCLSTCTSLTLVAPEDLADWRYCARIDGDLIIDVDFAQITAADLPYLREITGSLQCNGESTLTHLTLSAVQTVGRYIAVGNNVALQNVVLPALTHVGGAGGGQANDGIQVGVTAIERLELPSLVTVDGFVGIGVAGGMIRLDMRSLTTVTGNFNVSSLAKLSSANLSALASVGGDLTLADLWKLPYTSIGHLDDPLIVTLGNTVTVSSIGCCGESPHECTLGDYTCD